MQNEFETEDYCRCCLAADSDLFSMSAVQINNDQNYLEVYRLLSSELIPSLDFDPKICNVCIELMKSAFYFRVMCSASTNTLKLYLNKQMPRKSPRTRSAMRVINNDSLMINEGSADMLAQERKPAISAKKKKPVSYTYCESSKPKLDNGNNTLKRLHAIGEDRKPKIPPCLAMTLRSANTVKPPMARRAPVVVKTPIAIKQETPNICIFCGTQMQNVAGHMRATHTEMKRFKCKTCEKKFSNYHGLIRHMKDNCNPEQLGKRQQLVGTVNSNLPTARPSRGWVLRIKKE